MQQRQQPRPRARGPGGGEQRPLTRRDDDRRAVLAREPRDVAPQPGQVERRPAAPPLPLQRPRRERDDGQARRARGSGERSGRAGEHDGALDRRSPREQHALRAAEHAGGAHEEHRPRRLTRVRRGPRRRSAGLTRVRRGPRRRSAGLTRVRRGPRRRSAGLTPARATERRELPRRPARVAAEQRVTDRARRERQRLGCVVERERAVATDRPDDRAPPRREDVERLALPQHRVAAGVTDPQLRVQDRGHPGRARTQAQLHVLGEQVRGRVERAEPAQRGGLPGQARGDRPADGPRALRAPRLGALAHGARQQRRMQRRRGERADRPWQRVRRALHRAVALEQPRDVQRARVRGGERRQLRERAVEQLAVGIEQHGDRVARALQRRCCWRRRSRGCRAARARRRPSRRRDPRRRPRCRCRPRRAAAARPGARRSSAAARPARRRSRAARRRP